MGILGTILNKLQMMVKSLDKNVVFSIGENCLADEILSRNNLKSFSSPYSSGRSNIEYVLMIEKEDFIDFLNKAYLEYEYFNDKRVVRNKKYVCVENQYNTSVTNGFEFTHHDVFKKRINNTIKRRYKRLLKLKNKNVIMLYHHRFCNDTNIDLLTSAVNQLSEIYKKRGNQVSAFVFTQDIVAQKDERRVEKQILNGVNFYRIFCLQEWAGDDENVFWAKCDDDLIAEMISDIKKKLK